MNLLQINITNSCNKSPSCWYCPFKQWLVPIDNPDINIRYRPGDEGKRVVNILTNEAVLKYFDEYIDPDKWIIELTGGEPGLYPEIAALIFELSKRGYFVLVRTNGSLYIPKAENVLILAAWHLSEKDPPKYYDIIQILREESDSYIEKVKYCQENKIRYSVQWLEQIREKKRIRSLENERSYFLGYMCLNSSGSLAKCWKYADDLPDEQNIFNMHPPVINDNLKCGTKCYFQLVTEMFLPEYLKAKIKEDYDKEIGRQSCACI